MEELVTPKGGANSGATGADTPDADLRDVTGNMLEGDIEVSDPFCVRYNVSDQDSGWHGGCPHGWTAWSSLEFSRFVSYGNSPYRAFRHLKY